MARLYMPPDARAANPSQTHLPLAHEREILILDGGCVRGINTVSRARPFLFAILIFPTHATVSFQTKRKFTQACKIGNILLQRPDISPRIQYPLYSALYKTRKKSVFYFNVDIIFGIIISLRLSFGLAFI
jgi:hypothetical protein